MNEVMNQAITQADYTMEGTYVHHDGKYISIHVEGIDTFTYPHVCSDPMYLNTMLKGKVVRVGVYTYGDTVYKAVLDTMGAAL